MTLKMELARWWQSLACFFQQSKWHGIPKDGRNKFTSHTARFSLTFGYWTRMMSYTLFCHDVHSLPIETCLGADV